MGTCIENPYIYDVRRLSTGLSILVSRIRKTRGRGGGKITDPPRGAQDKIAIYNEGFVPLAGGAHPTLMGLRFEDGFPEIWPHIKPVFDMAETTRRAVDVLEMPLMVQRSGFLEETIFTGNFNPVRGDCGKVDGYYNAVFEITRQKLGERRTTMLNRLGNPKEAYTTNTIATHVMSSLESNSVDIPMALMYGADEESEPGKCLARLRGHFGVPEGHALRKDLFDLSSSEGLMPLLRQAKTGVVNIETGPLFDNIEWGGFKEPSKFVTIMSLWNGGRLFGFLVVGTNPRRLLDDDHTQFMTDLGRQVSATIAAVVGTEEARKRQDRLERELAERERQINYMAKHAGVAMQHVAVTGETIWANDTFYKLTNYPGQPESAPTMDILIEEDQPAAEAGMLTLLSGAPSFKMEARVKRQWQPPSGPPEPATLLAFGFPYLEHGEVKTIMSCLTDVSLLKWQEKWQARAAQEAIDAKKRQEDFVDAISHEVRNPLSAIFQLADLVSSSLADVRARGGTLDLALKALEENVEAAETILLCANHQKRIVDDVLTLSKLDFMLLDLSPLPTRPIELVESAVKMFEAESLKHDVQLEIIRDKSFEELGVDWVCADSSRVTQIFINVLSNAIKFTKGEMERRISISYGACSSETLPAFSKSMHWAPMTANSEDSMDGPDWGDGEKVYLTFSTTDTGTGVSQEEIQRLFRRFEQASSKTFVKYGGSGLGLFISQRLAEKQGGRIGVTSPGKGSTFVFYIKARRTTAPVPAKSSIQQLNSAVIDTLSDKFSSTHFMTNGEKSRPIHVLLVEDNIVNQKILRKQLTKAGCVVSVANHGLEALDFIKTTTCWYEPESGSKPNDLDLILMDWEMPIMDGLACSREVRRLQQEGKIIRHVQIIATTANTRKEQIEAALTAGSDDVLPKPFVISELMSKMIERLAK